VVGFSRTHRAATAAVGGRVEVGDGPEPAPGHAVAPCAREPAAAPAPPLPGPWGAVEGPEPGQGKVGLPPAREGPSEAVPEIPQAVLEGLEAVLGSDSVHYFIPEDVAEAAARLGFEEAARWVRENPTTYVLGLFGALLRRGR